MQVTQPPVTPAVAAHALYKTVPFGRGHTKILSDVSLTIASGEFVTIMGPSGSGKSTLLGILAGLDTPTSGQVRINGVEITSMREARLAVLRNHQIGMVFQAFNLIPTLTAQENVALPLYAGHYRGNPATPARDLLAQVGLQDRLRHKPHQLSGGEQQRVAIARALVTAPTLVIMDEPTGNLDHANGQLLLHLIQDLRQATATTFVLATHDASVAATADRVIQVNNGRIVEGSVAR